MAERPEYNRGTQTGRNSEAAYMQISKHGCAGPRGDSEMIIEDRVLFFTTRDDPNFIK